jgi:hypothetical protein
MGGFIYPDGLRLWLLRRSFAKKIAEAKGWPTAQGEVNGWKIVQAGTDAPFGLDSQIEAGFHFIVNGEYFGGYVRSEPMVHREAEKLGQGAPKITVRYDPSNPDRNFVLAEDNSGKLPFEIYSGPKAG